MVIDRTQPEEKAMLMSFTKSNHQTSKLTPPIPGVDHPTRETMIARAAYLAAERRGFEGGSAQEDWLAAETQVDEQLKRSQLRI
ncbi:MAG: DUF2934 domain-containing protein [Deltaproteobacteria bacterium]|nr:DUF2934 domain-containing protein [Deltaproteobacteria bacterium]